MEDGPFRNTRSSSTGTEKSGVINESVETPVINKNRIGKTGIEETKLKQKARTPSGQEINISVGDIRNFFTPKEDQEIRSGGEQAKTTGAKKKNRSRLRNSSVSVNPWTIVQPKWARKKSVKQNEEQNMKQKGDEEELDARLRDETESNNNKGSEEVQHKQQPSVIAISERIMQLKKLKQTAIEAENYKKQEYEREQNQLENEKQLEEMAIPFANEAESADSTWITADTTPADKDDQNPQVLNIGTVMLMFNEIKKGITDSNTERKKERKERNGQATRRKCKKGA